MAQVQHNTREQALKAGLPDTAETAIVDAMGSHQELATRLLSDSTSEDRFVGLLYENLRRGDPGMLAELRDGK